MSNSKNIKLIFLVLVFSTMFLSTNMSNIENLFSIDVIQRKSDIPDLSAPYMVSPFVIDDSDPTKDWYHYAHTYSWCTGQGSVNDPYIIDYIMVDGSSVDNCIEIINSNVHFIIQNSYLHDAKSNGGGVYLNNTNNGIIKSNDIYDCVGNGVKLVEGSSANTIIGNEITENFIGVYLRPYSVVNTISHNYIRDHVWGIVVEDADYNTVKYNNVSLNSNDGIVLDASRYCYVIGNEVSESIDGIDVYLDSYNSTINDNIVYDCIDSGLGFDNSDSNFLNNNTVSDCNYGIYFDDCVFNTVTNSYISSCTVDGIYFENGGWCGFTGGTISGNTNGIRLDTAGLMFLYDFNIYNNVFGINLVKDSFFIGIDGCNIYSNTNDGINIGMDNDAIGISDCNIYDNSDNGIECLDNEDIDIYECIIDDNNGAGIQMDTNVNCEIYDNTITDSGIGVAFNGPAVLLLSSNSISIYDNYINENDYGVVFSDTHTCDVYDNTIQESTFVGIDFDNGDNNNIYRNIIKNNQWGVTLDGSSTINEIWYNCFSGNDAHAIDDGVNFFDNFTHGNYWDNYSGVDTNGDGIGDTVHDIPGLAGNQDLLPLMECPLIPKSPTVSDDDDDDDDDDKDDEAEETNPIIDFINEYWFYLIIVGIVAVISVLVIVYRKQLSLDRLRKSEIGTKGQRKGSVISKKATQPKQSKSIRERLKFSRD